MTDRTGFVVPDEFTPRQRYRAVTSRLDQGPGVSTGTRVVVQARSSAESDDWVDVACYDRNYGFYSTFEPFRQLRDGEWRDYALISSDYTHLAVLDLSTGAVIAVEQPSADALAWARARKSDAIAAYAADAAAETPSRRHWRTAPLVDIARGVGFCPVEFHVPDWWEVHDRARPGEDGAVEAHQARPCGEFGVYAGCMWGDDTAWKVQYVDLSRIAEGVVTTDDRFGYVELPTHLRLEDAVRYDPYDDAVELTVPMTFSRTTGKADRAVLDFVAWANPDS